MSEPDDWPDLIAAASGVLRDALRADGQPAATAARLRVMPPWTGDAVLVTNLGHLVADPGRLAVHLAAPVVGLAGEGREMALHLDPAALRQAVNVLPAVFRAPDFPTRVIVEGIPAGATALAVRRVRAALDAASYAGPPVWDGGVEPSSLPLLRALIGAAREGAGPSSGWQARLSAALDFQWRHAGAPLMRLIDPGDDVTTHARLALAARGAALLARHVRG